MKDQAIIVVSFGTSYAQSRSITIGAIESTIAESFPDVPVRRAFTSNFIRKKLAERDGIAVDSVQQALEKLADEGIRNVILVPTHILEGEEYYSKIVSQADAFKDRFESVKVAHALLTEDSDFIRLTDIIDERTRAFSDGRTARVFMGHGTEHESNTVYKKLQDTINSRGFKDMFIGTVEAIPSVEVILQEVKATGAEKVLLMPLMIVAGDHATNDMAGDEPDSWKNIFLRAGFETECIIEGLGSNYQVQKMIADHCRLAMQDLPAGKNVRKKNV